MSTTNILIIITFILFVAFGLLFIKYGDSWEYRHSNDKEDKK